MVCRFFKFQASIWTNADVLLIGSMETYFRENLKKVQWLSFTKPIWKLQNIRHFALASMCQSPTYFPRYYGM